MAIVVQFLAGKYGIQLMTDYAGWYGGAMAGTLLKAKKAVRVDTLMTGSYIRHLYLIFNMVIENKDYFMGKWQIFLNGDDILKAVTAKRFIQIFSKAETIDRFDVDLYFKLVEKIVVYDARTLFVCMLDGSDVECEIE